MRHLCENLKIEILLSMDLILLHLNHSKSLILKLPKPFECLDFLPILQNHVFCVAMITENISFAVSIIVIIKLYIKFISKKPRYNCNF